MTIPKSKEELKSSIKLSYTKLIKEIDDINISDVKLNELEWHNKWTFMSVHNLLSYLIWWWELVLKWEKIKSEGREPYFPENGYKWNELWKLAQKFYSDYESLTWTELISSFTSVVDEIIILIERKSDTELYQELWYNQWTLWKMIQFNTFSPYKNAFTRIRKWKKFKYNR